MAKCCFLSLATEKDWIDSSGEKQKGVDFHKIVVWQKLADICAKFLTKGSSVMIEGRLSNRQYELSNNEKRFVTEVVANEVNIIKIKKARWRR
jgi:single-strand DNA-binding protein